MIYPTVTILKKDSEKQGGIFQKKVVKYRKDTENKTDTHKKGASV